MSESQTLSCRIAAAGGRGAREPDQVVLEEPLEIRIAVSGESPRPLAITMRTPGADRDLAAGLLFSEGVVRSAADISSFAASGAEEGSVLAIELAKGVDFDPERLSRALLSGSSCGICGRATLDLVWQAGVRPFRNPLQPDAEVLARLPETMRERQTLFQLTGGSHAAALFDCGGQLERIREDVGRHNAVDKLVGSLLMEARLPPGDAILAVSGRASYELVQKALMAGIPCLAAVGAPSSLAVELAAEFRMTLVGFAGRDGGNVYSTE